MVPVDSAHVLARGFDEEIRVRKLLLGCSRDELFLKLNKIMGSVDQRDFLSLGGHSVDVVNERSVPLLLQVLERLVQILEFAQPRVPGLLVDRFVHLVVSLLAGLVD